jgi:Xaa-Pro aminopeptidase
MSVGKAQETYDESVMALHNWLQFLDAKEVEIQAQMERLRRKGGEATEEVLGDDSAVLKENEPVAPKNKEDAWL